MKHATPKVTIDLAEYLELKSTAGLEAEREKTNTAEKIIVLHQMFIARLYTHYTTSEKLTNDRVFRKIALGCNADMIRIPARTGMPELIEIKPKF